MRGNYGRKIPDIPHLPPSPQLPEQWHDWEKLVLAHRLEIMAETIGDEQDPLIRAARDREVQRCRASRLYMLATYGAIFEARPEEEDGVDDGSVPIGGMLPFIPYPFQIWIADQYYEARKTRGSQGDILNVKARDMGLSNLYGFLVAGDWMCEQNFSARLLSRVEDLVDETGNPDSLFWKVEMFIKSLPKWLFERLAPGFKWTGIPKHRQDLKFIHPTRPGNTIIGESTNANAGRGGRATVIIYDEAAFMENFGAIWQAGRDASRHRIAISTVSTSQGLDFYNLHKGRDGYTQPRVIAIRWDEHPHHDEAWRRAEEERDSPQAIAQELDMDYFAGQSEWIYPASHEISPGHFPYVPGAGHVYTTMDNGYDDDFAMIRIQYIRETGRFRVFGGYQSRHKVTDYYGSMLKGVPESNFRYDERARQWMLEQQQLPPQTYTIDLKFKHVSELTGTSPYERFIEKYDITCHMELNPRNREHTHRWATLGALLPLFDFNDDEGSVEVLEALQRYRLKDNKGKDVVGEQKTPIHDRDSHYVTALEWFALAWPSIRYSSDQDVAARVPPAHNSPQERRNGPTYTPANPTRIAESGAPGCPRGFAPCAWRSADGSCQSCGLGRTVGGPVAAGSAVDHGRGGGRIPGDGRIDAGWGPGIAGFGRESAD